MARKVAARASHTDGGVIDRRVLLPARHAAAVAPALRNVSTKYVQ